MSSDKNNPKEKGESGYILFNEGTEKKGGVNKKPTTPPPASPPKGQGGKK